MLPDLTLSLFCGLTGGLLLLAWAAWMDATR
jgi:hypothetical protein